MATLRTTTAPRRYIVVTFTAFPEDGQFSAVCKEFDIATCGDTEEEALGNIKNAVEAYLETIEELGERSRVFKKRGIKIHRTSRARVEVDVSCAGPTMTSLLPV